MKPLPHTALTKLINFVKFHPYSIEEKINSFFQKKLLHTTLTKLVNFVSSIHTPLARCFKYTDAEKINPVTVRILMRMIPK